MATKKSSTKFTNHAIRRMQQRGIRKPAAEAIRRFADKKVPIGDGSVSWPISKQRLKELVGEGDLKAQMTDKLNNTCLVMATGRSGTKVVTALHHHGKAGRHYRKFCRRRWRRHRKWIC